MTNILLSSKSSEWYTPKHIVDLIHEVIPDIDLDPASSEQANKLIRAKRIITKEQDGLATDWAPRIPQSIYINSPGGKQGNKSMTGLFWEKLMILRESDMLEEAIFMGFSLEHLAVTQSCFLSMCDFPICVPRRRIRFLSPSGRFNSPTHSNVIAYVPGISNNTSKFKAAFSDLGKILHPS